MEPKSIRYEADTKLQLEESLHRAKADYELLVEMGYPSVQVIVSNHAYSEGVWVEAREKPGKLSPEDYLIKSNI